MSPAEPRLRIDKWLWAARFFKTRSLAATAVDHGKILINGQRVKPAKEVVRGDMLDISNGELRFAVVVEGINEQRRPAVEARLLYTETPASLARRQHDLELKKLAPMPGSGLRRRPTKRDGRLIRRLESVPD